MLNLANPWRNWICWWVFIAIASMFWALHRCSEMWMSANMNLLTHSTANVSTKTGLWALGFPLWKSTIGSLVMLDVDSKIVLALFNLPPIFQFISTCWRWYRRRRCCRRWYCRRRFRQRRNVSSANVKMELEQCLATQSLHGHRKLRWIVAFPQDSRGEESIFYQPNVILNMNVFNSWGLRLFDSAISLLILYVHLPILIYC